jgi:uncharacterized protein DUF6084
MPALSFVVEGAEALRFAAAPTLSFRVGIANAGGELVRSLALDTQIRIAATHRAYDPATRERLARVFGDPERWSTTLRSLFWTRASVLVPPFRARTSVEMPVPCTYDFEVAASRYLHALGDGHVPLELLFSGTMFYDDQEGRLRAERIPWDREAEFRLPVETWRDVIERHFPNTAWVRLDRDTFGRLWAYRTQRALASWDEAVEALLSRAEP